MQKRKFKFSEASVRRAAAPARGRVVYFDDTTPGLALRVSHTGARTFYFVAKQRQTRKLHWDMLGQVDAIALEGADGARDVVRKRWGAMAHGADLAIDRAVVRAEPTLGALIEDYFAGRDGRRSVERDRAEVWQLWLGTLPDAPRKKHGRVRVKPPASVDWTERRAGSITEDELRGLIDAICATGKRRTAGRVHELLHAAYEWGIRRRRVKHNPAAYIDAPGSGERKRIVQASEFPQLLRAFKETPQPWRDLLELLLFVGYRRTAVQAMRWADLDLDAGVWVVPDTASKNREATVLPITGPALTILKRRRRNRAAGSEWVFPGESKAGHIGRPKHAWRALLKRARLKGLVPHDLRRTVGSHMAMRGESLPVIAKVLGHRDIKSTKPYEQWQLDPVRRAVARAHRALARHRR